MSLDIKLVCTNCEKEVTQATLDECIYFAYDVKSATLEVDIPCECGNKFSRIKAEKKAEILIWPKMGGNFSLGYTTTQT